MFGLMMDAPLLLSRLIDYAADHHGRREVVSRRLDGSIERSDWRTIRTRAARLAKALTHQGANGSTRIASLAWNTLDHIEVFYAVLGLGAPLHTLNARLTVNDLCGMIGEVDDSICFVDQANLELAGQIAPLTKGITRWIYLGETLPADAPPLPGLVARGEVEAGIDADFAWPEFDERRAATICFTSGTTGRPKGVVYSHRSITLSSIGMSMADMYAETRPGADQVVMPIAPIFHANGWMMPFTAPMNGHKLVLPGRAFDAPSIVDLMRDEGVTLAGAVPTVWRDVIAELDRRNETLPALRTALIAGTRLPQSTYEAMRRHGIAPRQTWGMTEVPGAARAAPPLGSDMLPEEERSHLELQRQGRVGFQADMRIVDDEGHVLPHDGQSAGALQVRGPTVLSRYLGEPPEKARSWLDTGDIAKLHPDSTVEIVDRSKDVIKSGGEWISSPALEAAALTHPAIAEAAAIAIPHPRWQERPLLLCVLAKDATVTADALRQHLGGTLARWWIPEDIRFVTDLPKTSVGKVNKAQLRVLFANPETISGQP